MDLTGPGVSRRAPLARTGRYPANELGVALTVDQNPHL